MNNEGLEIYKNLIDKYYDIIFESDTDSEKVDDVIESLNIWFCKSVNEGHDWVLD